MALQQVPLAFDQAITPTKAPDDRERALDLRLIHGNIVNVPSPAYVLGVFDQVNPTGAARAVDAALGGKLSALIEDRTFGGNLGEVSILPTPRQRSMTDVIVLVGLGKIGAFKVEFLETVAEQLIRVLVTAKFSSFTTVPITLNAGSGPDGFIKYFAGGLMRGLSRVDPGHDFQRIDLVEYDDQRFKDIKEALYRLRDANQFQPVRVMIREATVPKEAQGLMIAPQAEADPIYVSVCKDPSDGAFEYDVLSSRANASIAKRRKSVTADDKAIFDEIITILSTSDAIDDSTSDKLGKLILEESIIAEIEGSDKGSYVIIKHDRDSARIPWEITKIGNSFLSLDRGISRFYLREGGPPSAPRKVDATSDVDVLVIGNPTEDLRGAEEEAKQLVGILQANNGVRVKSLLRSQATRQAILDHMRSGEFEIIHYAGHAFFDKKEPGRSGLVCAGKETLSGKDIYGIPGLPWLMFCNACEAGMMASSSRGTRSAMLTTEEKEESRKQLANSIDRTTSLAEAFLLNGIPQFIGTYWEVGDNAAVTFGTTFYNSLVAGDAIGVALRKSRQQLRRGGEKDWANYMHYGRPKSRLRDR